MTTFDASRYWDDGTFEPVALASDIVSHLNLTRGPGGGLWWNDGGVYRPNGEDQVRQLVRRQLADAFRNNRLNEVMAYCRTLDVTITTAAPPDTLIHCANGVLDIDSLVLRDALPDERWTYRLPVAWNPDATCPAIATFVNTVVPADCVALVADVFGLCIMPTYRYRRSVMLEGPGGNGKSVLLRLAYGLLGPDNCSSVTLQELSSDRFSKAQLFGKLANIAGDLDARPVESSGTWKRATGGDPITADHKYGQPFQFVSYATLVFSANEVPVSHDQSDAYFTRWVIVPMHTVFVEGGPLADGERHADPTLTDRLTTQTELEGLLVRAVAGARRIRGRDGFAIPASVRDAVSTYRQSSDTVLGWVVERVTASPGHRMTRDMVYTAYRTWCDGIGRHPVSTRSFWGSFRSHILRHGIGMTIRGVTRGDDWDALNRAGIIGETKDGDGARGFVGVMCR